MNWSVAAPAIGGKRVDGTERIVWTAAAIVAFGIVIVLFHRRRVSRYGTLLPVLCAVAVTIALTLSLFEF